jgi:uncharacterized protein (DUF362 family)
MTPEPEQVVSGDLAGKPLLDRRKFLVGAGAAAAVGSLVLCTWWQSPAPVFVARNQRYDGDLVRTLRDGLTAVGLDPQWVRGKRVLLKPNLVEPSRAWPHRTTHPAVVAAAAEVFQAWGAQVTAGEGPGHVRDTELALVESGVQDALDAARVSFSDFNYESALAVVNRGRTSTLGELQFPESALQADLIVSLPKLKTHHWAGMTASMKNLYGVLPGTIYGWPKNVLHYVGISRAVVDINASLPPTIAVVDAILCMEGDGPILGTPKPMGLLAVGKNPTAVDATCARIMGLDPRRIGYLALAAGRLGPIAESKIPQRGERWQNLVQPFDILDVPHLRGLRA